MYVRAYDSVEDHYFKSNVYAIIDIGAYERYLVLEKKGGKSFFCDDYFESGPMPDEYTRVNSLGMRWRVLADSYFR